MIRQRKRRADEAAIDGGEGRREPDELPQAGDDSDFDLFRDDDDNEERRRDPLRQRLPE